MTKTIAVESILSDVISLLEEEGYDVVGMEEGDLEQADAVVVCGADDNLMGIQDILVDVPVIDADGKSAEEVLRDIENRLDVL